MRRTKLFFNGIIILTLLLVGLGNPSTAVNAEQDSEKLKADPRLLQMAEENPNDTFNVIIQKETKNKDAGDSEPEDEVRKEGGKVTRQLDVIVSFSAELSGKQILKLAKKPSVRWISADAPMVSAVSPGMESIRDDFPAIGYAGNNGTSIWGADWKETGETTNATAGMIRVASSSACAGGAGYCLRLDPSLPTGTYVSRQANLSGFVSVWLSFYRNNLLNAMMGGPLEQVQLQISSNGGTTWTTLASYSGTSNIGAATDSFDISAYASANTQIRFLIPTYQSGSRYLYIDNVEIVYARPSAFLSAVKADQLSLNGKGVTVAVVDSGLTTRNDDFKSGGYSRIIAERWFGDKISAKDEHGHGTHVAGIIGGNGAASSGIYRGVAPSVNLINLRVADKDGMTRESNVVEALQWVYNNKAVYNIRVVNLSLNSTIAQSYHTSPLDAAVEILWFNGIVVVVSAGNNGTGAGPVAIYPPANDPFVITVGAAEDRGTADLWDDHVALFSAYGSTEDGFLKPELVAPGRNLIAPLSEKAATVYNAHPMHRVGDAYFRMSGTSMSAPVVSGAVALLLQNEPGLNPDQVKYRLMFTANCLGNSLQLDYQVTAPDVVAPDVVTSDVAAPVVVDPMADICNTRYLDIYSAVYSETTEYANQGILPSLMLTTGENAVDFGSVGWNSVGWNSVGWNSVGWNSVGWNSVGWNSSTWDD